MKKEIKEIIREIKLSRPESKIDPAFTSSLRRRIKEESMLISKASPKNKNMFDFIFKKRFAFAFSGIMILVLTVIVSAVYLIPGKNSPAGENVLAIKDAGQNAFGRIILTENQASPVGEEQKALDSSSFAAPMAFGRGGGGTATDSSVIAPIWNYRYVYKGGDFTIGTEKLDVYRKLPSNSIKNSLANLAKEINLGFINLQSFQNLKINSIEIAEDKDSGYSIYLDGRNNAVSISMNWEKWPADIFNGEGVSISDEKAVSIANQFMSERGINLKNYGPGEVIRLGYKTFAPVMDVTVIYPLQINGKTVYDQSGQKYGINVQVNSKLQKVTNVYGIEINSLERSQYDSEINEKQAIEIAEKGGMFGGYTMPMREGGEGQQIADVELGTPEIKLVKFWVYKEGVSPDELYIPSLIFPVVSQTDQIYFYGPNIIVPLMGSLAQSDGGPVRILEGSSGTDSGK